MFGTNAKRFCKLREFLNVISDPRITVVLLFLHPTPPSSIRQNRRLPADRAGVNIQADTWRGW